MADRARRSSRAHKPSIILAEHVQEDSGDEEYEEEGDEEETRSIKLSGKRRGAATSPKPAPAKKPRRRPKASNPPAAPSNSLLKPVPQAPSFHVNDVSHLRMQETPDTLILKRWFGMRAGLEILREVPPTSMADHTMTPLSDRADVPGRSFKFKIHLTDIPVNWDPVEGEAQSSNMLTTKAEFDAMEKYEKAVLTWKIDVWNDMDPEPDRHVIQLFPEAPRVRSKAMQNYKGGRPIPTNRQYFRRGGPLDLTVCPTRVGVEKVAAEACMLLNKYPLALDRSNFPNMAAGSDGKDNDSRKIIELMSLQALDRSFDFRKIRYWFRNPIQPNAGQYFLRPHLIVSPNSKGAPGNSYIFFLPVFDTKPMKEDGKFANERPNAWMRLRLSDTTVTKQNIEQLPDIPSYWGLEYQVPKNVSKMRSSNISPDDMAKFVTYLSWKFFGFVGTREAMQTLIAELSTFRLQKLAPYQQGPFGGKSIFSWNGYILGFGGHVLRTIRGAVPTIAPELPRPAIALCMQSAYEVYKREKSTRAMMDELFVSAQELSSGGRSILSLRNHCKCSDGIERTLEAHHCMYCLRLVICANMTWLEDGRLVCSSHLKSGSVQEPSVPTARVKVRVSWLERGLESHIRIAIRNTLCTEAWIKGNNFQDAYGVERTDTYAPSMLNVSPDAVFPLAFSDGQFWVHHPSNVALTTYFMNEWKGTEIPMVLVASSAAAKSRHPDVYLVDIEKSFDHFWQIRILIPYAKALRIELARKAPLGWWENYSRMMHCGVYDGSGGLYQFNYRTYFQIKLGEGDKWNKDKILCLDRICQAIEQSAVYNPKGLSLPRGRRSPQGMPGAPWLWNPDHIYDNHDWEYLNRLFLHRFQRMDTTCDWKNDHLQECGETLFLTCVILWFALDGGKDELLGLRMTVHIRHPLRFSIGRALHVQPGSIMRTGWTVRHPTSLEDYDESLRTITMETWIANRGKLDFPVTASNVAKMLQLLEEVPTQSKYWSAYPPDLSGTSIKLPRDWRSERIGATQIEELTDDEELKKDYEAGAREEDDMPPKDIFGEVNNDLLKDVEEDTMGDSDLAENEEPSSTLQDDVDFLLEQEKHVPDDERERFRNAVMRLGKVAGKKKA
ncbi:hypothetical protein HBI25_207700 [Parastagonospora nodorum]|nr:hypothetical protein HBH61_184040 [Parastagonospora nodorum]KAH5210702.1 hypothetical protein HBI62_204850 [Parastagonospora nodorum]KAH5469170.1 hypothetical protein HBI31_196990 [Parastagonospora nodorum]KAH5547783.1 hypothetical protein HBI25_207700 [Parastagonospora nodorum]KAH5565489.1 hypothetical protein HBI24_240660 [Parastagonospora nodorum]